MSVERNHRSCICPNTTKQYYSEQWCTRIVIGEMSSLLSFSSMRQRCEYRWTTESFDQVFIKCSWPLIYFSTVGRCQDASNRRSHWERSINLAASFHIMRENKKSEVYIKVLGAHVLPLSYSLRDSSSKSFLKVVMDNKCFSLPFSGDWIVQETSSYRRFLTIGRPRKLGMKSAWVTSNQEYDPWHALSTKVIERQRDASGNED